MTEERSRAGAVDYWCNIFTEDGLRQTFLEPEEIAEVVRWWGLDSLLKGRSPADFVAHMDEAGVAAVMVPAARMRSHQTGKMLWKVQEEAVAELVAAAPGRVYGLVGINPIEGMEGVRRLERWISSDQGFVGAHIHPYGFGLPLNDRRYYPFYAKCVELGVPVVAQVGHSAERMPSALGRPLLVDDIALDFPDLRFVGAHTGWPWVEEMIAMAWKHRNVFIGTSAHHPRYWDPSLVRFANTRGRGKVLFGTDYPVMDYSDAISAIDTLQLREDARKLLLGDAARDLFSIR